MHMARHRRAAVATFILWTIPGALGAQGPDQSPPGPRTAEPPAIHRPSDAEEGSTLVAQRPRRPGAEQEEEKPQEGKPAEEKPAEPPRPFVPPPVDPPLGFAGRLLTRPEANQTSPDFVPVPDRWRIGVPSWTRFERPVSEAPYVRGRWWDPYNQNVLKGDYPIIGQHTFLSLSAISDSLFEGRRIPVPSNVSADRPGSTEFFGRGDQFLLNQNFILSLELFHGGTAFGGAHCFFAKKQVRAKDFFGNDLFRKKVVIPCDSI